MKDIITHNIHYANFDNNKCKVNQRCKNFRHCEICNNIRQKKICDITELASRFSPKATYTVIMPFENNEQTIKAIKTKITRKLRKSADGIFCSVEVSKNQALHLNLLITSQQPIKQSLFENTLKQSNTAGDIFLEDIQSGNNGLSLSKQVRNITAYSLKQQSIPHKYEYSGNMINLSGNMRTLKQIVHDQKSNNYNAITLPISFYNTIYKELGVKPSQNINTPHLKDMLIEFKALMKQIKSIGFCYSNKYGKLSLSELNQLITSAINSKPSI